MRDGPVGSLNPSAIVADQADVLNWPDVNDRSTIPFRIASCASLGFVMRSVLSATLMVAAAMWGTSAQAQMTTSPSTAGTKPKPVTTIPIRPPLQKPEETANAMAQAERMALQSDLAWVGQYNGAITGDVSERMVNAIKEFQKTRGGKQTGVLHPHELGVLAATA